MAPNGIRGMKNRRYIRKTVFLSRMFAEILSIFLAFFS